MAAGPFAVPALVIVAVEIEAVAMQTQGYALGIVTALQTGERVFILGVAPGNNGTQRLQVVVDEAQDVVKTLTGIANDLANVEVRETTLDVLKAGDGLQVVIAIGRDERARHGPIGGETVIHEVEAFRLVAKVVLAPTAAGFVARASGEGSIGGRSGLVGTSVVDISGFKVAESDETAMMSTSVGITVTPLLVCFPSGTDALRGREETSRVLIAAAHPRAGCNQLTVGGEGHAPFGRVAGKSGGSRNDAVGHQPQE